MSSPDDNASEAQFKEPVEELKLKEQPGVVENHDALQAYRAEHRAKDLPLQSKRPISTPSGSLPSRPNPDAEIAAKYKRDILFKLLIGLFIGLMFASILSLFTDTVFEMRVFYIVSTIILGLIMRIATTKSKSVSNKERNLY